MNGISVTITNKFQLMNDNYVNTVKVKWEE